MIIGRHSRTVVQWLTMLPHIKKVVGLNPAGAFLWGVCTFVYVSVLSCYSGFLTKSNDIHLVGLD